MFCYIIVIIIIWPYGLHRLALTALTSISSKKSLVNIKIDVIMVRVRVRVVVHVLFNRIISSMYLVFWYLCLLVNGDVDIEKISQIFQEE